MNYKVNYSFFNSVFAVPSVVVDKHIKLAGSAQLKVLLWMLRNADCDYKIEDLSKALGLPVPDIRDCLQYWAELDILVSVDKGEKTAAGLKAEGGEALDAEGEAKQDEKGKALPKSPPLRPDPPKPTHSEVAKLVGQNPEISFLLNEAQLLLGRPISPAESSTLIHIHQYYGLPTSVILTLIKYAQSIGKTNMSYIEKVAYSWSDEGIDTPEKAEQKIEYIQKIQDKWYKFEKKLGLTHRSPSTNEKRYIDRWFIKWGFSMKMVHRAYEQCVDNTGKMNFAYMNKVLEKWYKKGIKTIEQVEEDQKRFLEKKQKKKQGEGSGITFDLEEYDRSSLYETPVYKKE